MADINLGVGAANSASDAYEIANSLKFEADNTEYLSHSSSSGSGTKVTYSFWCKRTELDSSSYMQVSGISTSSETVRFMFYQDSVRLDAGNSSTGKILVTNRKFRDTSAWYHFFVVIDTTLSTEGDRHQLWVNGVRETSFSTEQYPTQNFSLATDQSNATWRYGAYDSTYYKFSGYLAECYRLDGIAASYTDFGKFDTNGIWIPQEYTGSFGSNGHYLDFEDSSSLGADDSGNSNNFTLNNIAAVDQATDTPTNNFCTLNILDQEFDGTNIVTDGATNVRIAGSGSGCIRGTQAVSSGKWYWEFKLTPINTSSFYGVWGIYTADTSPPGGYPGQSSLTGSWGVYGGNGEAAGSSGFNTFYTDGFSSGDIIGLAYDVDGGTLKMYKNGTLVGANSGDIIASSGVSHPAGFTSFLPAFADGTNSPEPSGLLSRFEVNFGGFTNFSISSGNSDANGYGNFEYAPPTGYYAICSKNLSEFG